MEPAHMAPARQFLFWGLAFLAFVALIALLGEVLLPFVLSLVLAYFLDPLATWLERRGLSRLGASIAIAVLFGLLAVLFVLFLGPVLLAQLSELVRQIPVYLGQLREIVATSGKQWLGQFFPGMELGTDGALRDLARQAAGNLDQLLASLWTSGKALFSFLSLVLITPVVTFFLLKDWPGLVARIDGWLPRDHAPVIRLLARRINRSIAGFIRGQVTISIMVGIFYAIALTLAGLKYGLLIGLVAGVLNIVPFLGSLVGFLISATMAVVQYWPEWQPILLILGIFLFGQLVDANFLTPKIIGDRINLHPVWLIFALVVSGYLLGLLGMLIAIPLAAAIGVLVRYGLERYKQSALYLGSSGEQNKQESTTTP